MAVNTPVMITIVFIVLMFLCEPVPDQHRQTLPDREISCDLSKGLARIHNIGDVILVDVGKHSARKDAAPDVTGVVPNMQHYLLTIHNVHKQYGIPAVGSPGCGNGFIFS